MIDTKKVGIVFLIGFIGIVLWSGLQYTSFLNQINTGSLLGLAYYIITNPAYILIFAGIVISNQVTAWKEIVAGLAMIWAFDIISFPRLAMDALPTDPNFLANSDAIVMGKLIGLSNAYAPISYHSLWFFYYIILPIGLILLAAQLLGVVNLGKRVKNGGVK